MKPSFSNEVARFVIMTDDYTTESLNLGVRTYLNGAVYQLTEIQIREIVDAGKGDAFTPEYCKCHPDLEVPDLSVVEHPLICIIPTVSRWFTANGEDTYHLNEGVKKEVPSNLAAQLVVAGYAQYAA